MNYGLGGSELHGESGGCGGATQYGEAVAISTGRRWKRERGADEISAGREAAAGERLLSHTD